MWKKLTAFLISLSLMITNILLANAAPLRGLVEYAYTERNGVFETYREYIRSDLNQSVTMEVGEYKTVYPLHWIQTEYLSYVDVSVNSSDSSVVSASAYNPDQMPYEEGIIISDGLQQTFGIKLHAKREGTARITVSYRTILTRLGLEYEDKRDQNAFKQTIDVRVGSSLKVKTEFRTSTGRKVGNIRITMSNLWEQMSEEQKSAFDRKFIRNIISTIIGLVPGKLATVLSAVVSNDIDGMKLNATITAAIIICIMPILLYLLGPIGMVAVKAFVTLGTVFNVYAFISTLTGVIQIFMKNNNVLKGMKAPGSVPKDLQLWVTFENVGNSSITDIRYNLWGNEYFAFAFPFEYKMWGTSLPKFLPSLEAGEMVTKKFNIYPKYVTRKIKTDLETTISAIESIWLVYTGEAGVNGTYNEEGSNGGRNFEVSSSINAFSDITYQQNVELREDMNSKPEYYRTIYGTSDYFQLIYVACPVKLMIFDQEGTQLAVIGTDDTEIFEAEGLQAGAIGDAKYVILQEEYQSLYHLELRATGEGTMNVFTYENDKATGAKMNQYEEVSLAKDTFMEVFLSDEAAAVLKENGITLETTVAINEETVMEWLKATDVSERAAEKVCKAILRGLVTDGVVEKFQDAVTLEEFAQLLMNFYLGSTEHSKVALEEKCYAAMAAEAGIYPESRLNITEEEAMSEILTVGDAVWAVYRCLELLDRSVEERETKYSMELEVETQGESISTPEEILEKLRTCRIFAGEEMQELKTEEYLLTEQAICGLYDLWKYCSLIADRDQFVIRESSKLLDEMETSYLGIPEWNQAAIRYLKREHPDTIFGSCSIYMPTYTATDINITSEWYKTFERSLFFSQYYQDVYGDIVAPAESGFSMSGTGIYLLYDGYGSTVDLMGTVYQWCPCYLMNDNGEKLDDTIYLCVSIQRNMADYEMMEKENISFVGENSAEFMICADQEIVAEYISLISPLLETMYEKKQVQEYNELSEGSTGESVQRLQEALIKNGYLLAKADGQYGVMTTEAVSNFQEAIGLTVSGNADAATQEALFGELTETEELLKWLSRYRD